MRRNKRRNRNANANAITGEPISPYVIVQVAGSGVRVQHEDNPSDGVTCPDSNCAYLTGLRLVREITQRGVSAALPFNTMEAQLNTLHKQD